ncbi:MAG: isocitrate lyase/phosphoenolpyruvate mutase family protein [Acidobacteria bacterium]|nr:isocitrate lyase/phosphoenolpyruvate mutase family protein [Acidobacteriota bacterium]
MSDQGTVFRALHSSGCFVMPNPWDLGTARVLAQLGFRAVATTSSGFAWSQGRQDHGVPVEEVLAHLSAMAQGVAIPVNADFEAGFADDPDEVARHVSAAAATGIAGLSIEDSTLADSRQLYALAHAVERVRAARAAIDASGRIVVLTARSEGFLAGHPDLEMTIERLTAFAEAGADCLYAPGVRSLEAISRIVRAVSPLPVNVLVGSGFTTVAELAALGVRRISVGGALARTAWAATIAAAREIAERGTFTSLDAAVPSSEIDGRFASEK